MRFDLQMATMFVFGAFMILIFISILIKDVSSDDAVENLQGCEVARLLDERVCLKDSSYHFVDIQCEFWGGGCTAELVTVERFVVEPK